jgi:hypothetical protein
MSARLDRVLNEIKELSFEELLTLQRQIIDEVQTKAVPTAPEAATTPDKASQPPLIIPQAYRRNPEDVEASLLAVFGPEQLAAMKDVDLSNLPPGSRTVTEMISEDREDRF